MARLIVILEIETTPDKLDEAVSQLEGCMSFDFCLMKTVIPPLVTEALQERNGVVREIQKPPFNRDFQANQVKQATVTISC